MNIRSIIIGLQRWHIPYITGNWTALRSLRVLPHLRSLRVVLIGLHMSPDDPSCQIIAETAMSFVDFSFFFRRASEFHELDVHSAFTRSVRSLNSSDDESLIYPGTRNPSVRSKKMGVD